MRRSVLFMSIAMRTVRKLKASMVFRSNTEKLMEQTMMLAGRIDRRRPESCDAKLSSNLLLGSGSPQRLKWCPSSVSQE